MDNKPLTPVLNHPYLGIKLQQNMKWTTHINNTTTKAQKTLNMLKRNLKQTSTSIKSLAYKTIVRPQLEYASAIWDPNTKDEINKIDKIQKRAARWVFQDYSSYTSVSLLQAKLKWTTLAERRLNSRLVIFYKTVHNLIAIPIPPYIQIPTRTTRHNQTTTEAPKYRQLTTNTNQYKYSFFPRTITDWNSLPPSLCATSSVQAFKDGLARHSP